MSETKINKEDEAFLKGKPNRMEVCNYINGLLEDKYMPRIQGAVEQVQNSAFLGLMAIQALLIKKGICTGEEIQEAIQELIRANEEKEKEKERKEKERNREIRITPS